PVSGPASGGGVHECLRVAGFAPYHTEAQGLCATVNLSPKRRGNRSPKRSPVENLGLQCADPHPYPRRACPPASEEARQLQRPIHRNDLRDRLPFSTLSSTALASRLLQSPSGSVSPQPAPM